MAVTERKQQLNRERQRRFQARRQQQTDALHRELETLRHRVDDLTITNAALERETATLRDDNAALRRDNVTLQEALRAARQAAKKKPARVTTTKAPRPRKDPLAK
jgi:regulator of replication initiation timing